MNIRIPTNKDVPAILEIYKEGWLATYPNEESGISRADVEEKVRQFTHFNINEDSFVAENGSRIIGVIKGVKGQSHTINSLYVTERNRGVGTELLKHIIKHFGQGTITLTVVSYNQGAIRFYKTNGFNITNRMIHSATTKLPSGVIIPEIEMVRVI